MVLVTDNTTVKPILSRLVGGGAFFVLSQEFFLNAQTNNFEIFAYLSIAKGFLEKLNEFGYNIIFESVYQICKW